MISHRRNTTGTQACRRAAAKRRSAEHGRASVVEKRSAPMPTFVLLAGLLTALDVLAASAPGVVVERVPAPGPVARAGLLAGDVLIAWRRPATPQCDAAEGVLGAPFDLAHVAIEQAPVGPVTLVARRDGQTLTFALPPVRWLLDVRPAWSEEVQAAYEAGAAAIASGALEAGTQSWLQTASTLAERGELVGALSLRVRAAQALTRARHGEAAARWELALATAVDDGQRAAVLEAEMAVRRELRSADAWERVAQAVLTLRRARGERLSAANALVDLGQVAWSRRDVAAAEAAWSEATALYEQLAPASAHLTRGLDGLGVVARARGARGRAEQLDRRAVALLEALPGPTDEHAELRLSLGIDLRQSGRLAEAEAQLLAALAVRRELEPEGVAAAPILLALANVANDGGDDRAAEDFGRQALALQEALDPEHVDAAMTLNNLGAYADARGDLEAAGAYWRRALELRERRVPDSADVAMSHVNLGLLARKRGQLDEAERQLERALAIQRRVAPESLQTALCLSHRARVALMRGDQQRAETLWREALALRERLAPASAPVAESLWSLAELRDTQGRAAEGAELILRALDTLDQQRSRLGVSDGARAAFSARFADLYRDAVDALARLGRSADAFHVLERSRAWSLLALLAERGAGAAALPSGAEPERARLNAEYDALQRELQALDPRRDEDHVRRATARLQELRARREALAAVPLAATALGSAWRQAEPLEARATRDALDPGTLLLAYSVGRSGAWLFAVDATSRGRGVADVSAVRLETDAARLEQQVDAFRALLRRADDQARDELARQARALYDTLLRPVDASILRARRLLVCPDGALRVLPFAALMRGERFVAELRPLHSVVSATLFAELRRGRRATPRAPRIVAFGDPLYPGAASAGAPAAPELRDAFGARGALASLPHTRREVDAIGRLFGAAATTHLGAEASEERAKGLDRTATHVHFACHAFVNERFPLNSGLALTIPATATPGRDNGLLQAWEIVDGLRLDAELVALSGCETGLGADGGGEGLLGLTRAFQYAGARSVLASLWRVPDASTADFMESFYRRLRAGDAKDEALRRAQVERIRRQGGARAPFTWAAFQLDGDWR